MSLWDVGNQKWYFTSPLPGDTRAPNEPLLSLGGAGGCAAACPSRHDAAEEIMCLHGEPGEEKQTHTHTHTHTVLRHTNNLVMPHQDWLLCPRYKLSTVCQCLWPCGIRVAQQSPPKGELPQSDETFIPSLNTFQQLWSLFFPVSCFQCLCVFLSRSLSVFLSSKGLVKWGNLLHSWLVLCAELNAWGNIEVFCKWVPFYRDTQCLHITLSISFPVCV